MRSFPQENCASALTVAGGGQLRGERCCVELLDTPPETLLGTGSPQTHSDHDAVLRPGDTLVIYTDGIVEHGRSAIDEGLSRLTRRLAELGQLDVDDLCDQLLARVVTGRTDDDIALLAVRCRPARTP